MRGAGQVRCVAVGSRVTSTSRVGGGAGGGGVVVVAVSCCF